MTTIAILEFKFLLVIAMAIPLTYGYDAVRAILLGIRTLLPVHVEQATLVGFMGVMIALGLWAFSLVERRCRRLGTISMDGSGFPRWPPSAEHGAGQQESIRADIRSAGPARRGQGRLVTALPCLPARLAMK